MNKKSDVPGEVRTTSLHISRFQLRNWFSQNKGTKGSQLRRNHSILMRTNIGDCSGSQGHKVLSFIYWCTSTYGLFILDEKWSYVTNRRRKIKKSVAVLLVSCEDDVHGSGCKSNTIP